MTATAVAVRERPILFSGPMVRAILKGRKTQTRRVVVVRKENGGGLPHDYPDNKIVVARIGDHAINETPTRLYGAEFRWSNGADLVIACPYGRPGDRLWVRESFAGPDHIGNGDQGVVGFGIEYKADGAFRAHGDCGCDGPCSGVLISHPLEAIDSHAAPILAHHARDHRRARRAGAGDHGRRCEGRRRRHERC